MLPYILYFNSTLQRSSQDWIAGFLYHALAAGLQRECRNKSPRQTDAKS
jgi:hypothetical protein